MARAAARKAARPERIVGKKELALELGWTRPRLDRRLNQDKSFPVRRRGDQRGGWEFELGEVIAYLQPSAAVSKSPAATKPPPATPEPPTARPRRAAVLHQGEETQRQRKDRVGAELLEDKLRKSRGELVEVAEVRVVLTTAVARLATMLNALPDAIVRKLGLADEQGPTIRKEIDEARTAFVTELRDLLGGD